MKNKMKNKQMLLDDLNKSGANIETDAAQLALFAHDIYDRGGDLTAIISPHNIEELSKAIKVAHQYDATIVPRGGGMSYTGGYTAKNGDIVMINMSRMNNILDINIEDMTVTVEAG